MANPPGQKGGRQILASNAWWEGSDPMLALRSEVTLEQLSQGL